MKVYKSYAVGSYAGGGAVVAANSPEEALELMFREENYYFMVKDTEGNNVPGYDGVTEFELVEDCIYHGVEPKILFSDIYEG